MKSTLQALNLETLGHILVSFLRQRSPLAPLQFLYARSKNFFQIPLPGFRPFVIGGGAANRQVLVTERNKLLWRNPSDPVTTLLRHGVLVVDGPEHDNYRRELEPLLTPGYLQNYIPQMVRQVDRVTATWKDGQTVDMLVESRRIALLIIMEALFSVDFWDDLPRMWKSILKVIDYISPGAWIVFPNIPRPGYTQHIRALDNYLYQIIQRRRSAPARQDLLGHLLDIGLDDGLIRDQMLTMLIAGHDTSTALLAWTFYLLGQNQEILSRLQNELEQSLQGQPPKRAAGWQPALLDEVIKESLRLYPPIHLGNRYVAEKITFNGQTVPAGERLFYSIYLTHRDPMVWKDPDDFEPERFADGCKPPPFTYVPFGGGPRVCIGAAFGQAEARLVLARLLQTHRFQLKSSKVFARMGATLEPSPGVLMRVQRKTE